MVHAAPAFFTLGLLALAVLSFAVSFWFAVPLALHMLLLFLSAAVMNRSITVGLLAVLTSYTQLFGYGCGFLHAFWKRMILGRDEYSAFRRNFYK
jgi:hypothetical protein